MKKNASLLYLEDDPVIRENLSEIFNIYFKNVFLAENGDEAFEIYKQKQIDVAILDISVPGINGLTLASKIRENDTDIEIIIISAYSDTAKLLQAVNLKLFSYLVKPIVHDELTSLLTKLHTKVANKKIIQLHSNYSWDKYARVLKYKDEIIKITKSETKIIQMLIDSQGAYLNSMQIQEMLFSDTTLNASSANNTVQLISRFKKKLEQLQQNEDFFIESCYGLGYKILF